jgi:hypothetical protein
MNIYILTLGRAGNQVTWSNLPNNVKKNTRLVVQSFEKDLYRDLPIVVLPDHIKNLPDTRQWLMYEHGHTSDKVAMLDDDLRFFKRRKDDREKFEKADATDIEELFSAISEGLDTHSHVGVLSREGGNRVVEAFKETTRMSRVLAYNVSIAKKLGILFNRVLLPEDFDTTLQYLYKGHKNKVLCNWVHDQGGSNAVGGCSTYRSLDVHNKHMIHFGTLHPNIVSVVEKTTKTAWGGGTRMDVIIQWKKALGKGLV